MSSAEPPQPPRQASPATPPKEGNVLMQILFQQPHCVCTITQRIITHFIARFFNSPTVSVRLHNQSFNNRYGFFFNSPTVSVRLRCRTIPLNIRKTTVFIYYFSVAIQPVFDHRIIVFIDFTRQENSVHIFCQHYF